MHLLGQPDTFLAPAALQRPQPPLRALREAAAGMRALTARWQPDEAAVAAFAAVCYRLEPRGCHLN